MTRRNSFSSVTGTGEAVVGGIIVHCLSRDVKTEATHTSTNQHNQHIDDCEADLSRGGKSVALVEMQPVDPPSP